MKEKSCVFCSKKMESVFDNWYHNQPDGGGEVQFIFSYGSYKFDLGIGNTVFRGIVCDECAEKYVGNMEKLTLEKGG